MNSGDLFSTFIQLYGTEPRVRGSAPGRVNILGEHVDYNGGVVLPAAIDRRVQILAAASRDGCTHLSAIDLDARVSLRQKDMAARVDIHGDPLPGWARYPAGVAWALGQAGWQVPDIQAVYSSDIPIGAGLSSSAAVEVGFAVIWKQFGGWQIGPLELAKICQRAENLYVGVSSGLMDQFASACGVKDHALVFDTRSLDWQAVALPANTTLVIADSGVRRSLTSSGYNDRRNDCETALEFLQQHLPEAQTLRDVPPAEFIRLGPHLPEIPRKRAEHVIHEIERVSLAVSAMQDNDKQALGALLYEGHASLRDLYEVSTPEQDILVELSRSIPGCFGARLTGAGFGGCTINLVESDHSQNFSAQLSRCYYEETGRNAKVYPCKASQGAAVENLL